MKIGNSRIKALSLAMLMVAAMIISVMPAMQVRAEASKEVPVVYGHKDENNKWVEDERRGTAFITQTEEGYDDLLDDIEYLAVCTNGYGDTMVYDYGMVLDSKYSIQPKEGTTPEAWWRFYRGHFTITFDVPEGYDLAYFRNSNEKTIINNGKITLAPKYSMRTSSDGYANNWGCKQAIYYCKSEDMKKDLFGENALVSTVPTGKKIVGVSAFSDITGKLQIVGEGLVEEDFFEAEYVPSCSVQLWGNTYRVYKYTSKLNDQVDIELPVKAGASKIYYEGGDCGSGYVKGQEIDVKDGRIRAIILFGDDTTNNNRMGMLGISYGSTPTPSGDGIEMYRLYNPNTTEHLYTDDAGERDWLAGTGWNYEGIAWIAPKDATKPVYRLFNPFSGEHHYTTDEGERGYLLGTGWNDEGIGWRTPDSGTPVYRLFNPNNPGAGSHHYTTDAGEKDYLAGTGWNYEGIAWYGL